MNFFILLRLIYSSLLEVHIVLNKFEELQIEFKTLKEHYKQLIDEYNLKIKEREECPAKTESKTMMREFLNTHYHPYLYNSHKCGETYFESIHKMLQEHITKIKSNDLSLNYTNTIAQSNDELLKDKSCIDKCTKEFVKMQSACKLYTLYEQICSQHQQILTAVKITCQLFYSKQLRFASKGKELALQVLRTIKIYICKERNITSTMESMSLDGIQD